MKTDQVIAILLVILGTVFGAFAGGAVVYNGVTSACTTIGGFTYNNKGYRCTPIQREVTP